MFNMQASAQPIGLLLQIIVQQYLNESYCISVVSDNILDANMISNSMTYISVNDSDEKLVERLLSVSEMGCSDYIVQMSEPELFMTVYVEVKKLGNARRSDKKLIFIYDEENANSYQNILSIDEMAYIPNILLIIPNNVTEACTSYDLVTHKYVGDDAGANDPLYLDRWNSCTQEFEVNSNLFLHDLKDLSGKSVRVACLTYKPFTILDVDKSVNPLGHDGFELRIMDEFCRWVNCTVEIITDEYQWGEIYENWTGNGVFGNTALDKADIGMTSLYTWYEIYQYLDFSASCVRTSVTAVAPAPRILISWELPLLAFTWEMWVMLLFTFVYASIALYIAQGFSAQSVIMTTFGMMVTQAQNDSGANWRVRSVTGWLLVTGLVLDNAYGGGLAATFTVPQYEKSIDTIQDIIDRKIIWGGTTDLWIYAIKMSQEPNIIKLVSQYKTYDAEYLKEQSFTRSMAFAVDRLPAGYFSVGEYLSKEAVSDLQIMLDDFYYGYTVLIARKNSPYIDKITSLIGRLHESGLMQAWETQVAQKYLNYEIQLQVRLSRVRGGVEIIPLGIHHVIGIFIVYGMGVAVSILIFLKEVFIIYVYKNKEIQEENLA